MEGHLNNPIPRGLVISIVFFSLSYSLVTNRYNTVAPHSTKYVLVLKRV